MLTSLEYAQRRHDDEIARESWAIAHGYITDPIPTLPRDDIHLCGVLGYEITGSRAACPNCKLAAPLDAGPAVDR